MRNRMLVVLALLLLPAAASAQGMRRGGRMGGPGRGEGPANPARVLLDHRSELKLTEDQAAKLEDFAKQWTAGHEAMRATMDSIRGSGTMRDLTEAQREQMRALRDAMMANSRKLHDDIRSTLTAEQLEQAAKFLPPPGRGRGGEMMRGRIGSAAIGQVALRTARRGTWRAGIRAGAFGPVYFVRPVRAVRPALRSRIIRRAFRPAD